MFKSRSAADIQFERQVIEDGVGYAGKRITEVICDQIGGNIDLARRFMLEELDAARQGNQTTIRFVQESGFLQEEYEGTIATSSWAEDTELNQVQMLFRSFTLRLSDDDLRVELSLFVLDQLMRVYQLGKYVSGNDSYHEELNILALDINGEFSEDEIFGFVFTGLNKAYMSVNLSRIPESYQKKLFMMSYAYAARTCSAGLYLQGYVDRDFVLDSHSKFQEFQRDTDHSISFQEQAADISLEFLQRFDSRLDRESIGIILRLALNQNTYSQYEQGISLPFEEVIQLVLNESTSSDSNKSKFELSRASNSTDEELTQFLRSTAFSLISSLGDQIDKFMVCEVVDVNRH